MPCRYKKPHPAGVVKNKCMENNEQIFPLYLALQKILAYPYFFVDTDISFPYKHFQVIQQGAFYPAKKCSFEQKKEA
jgi:hypothetical protein